MSCGDRGRTDKSVSDPAASERDAAPHGAVEVRCSRSGYSVDALVHDSAPEIGGKRSSKEMSWAVAFDELSHFLASRAPTGATLLNRLHLELLDHTLRQRALLGVGQVQGARRKGAVSEGQAKAVHKTLEAGKDSASQHHFGQHMSTTMSITMSSNGKSDLTVKPNLQRASRVGKLLPQDTHCTGNSIASLWADKNVAKMKASGRTSRQRLTRGRQSVFFKG